MPEHKNASRAPRRPLDLPTLVLTTGGLGFLRPAPGTWGSLPPVLVAVGLSMAGATAAAIVVTLLLILVASSAACIAWGGYAERRFGRKDASEVVADETAGVCLPALAAVWGAPWVSVWTDDPASAQYLALSLALVLFRAFDISKPWPMRRLERLPRGWGVLVDDLMAGLYAALCLLLVVRAAIWIA